MTVSEAKEMRSSRRTLSSREPEVTVNDAQRILNARSTRQFGLETDGALASRTRVSRVS